jgi:hypothetical protein
VRRWGGGAQNLINTLPEEKLSLINVNSFARATQETPGLTSSQAASDRFRGFFAHFLNATMYKRNSSGVILFFSNPGGLRGGG